jgi:hypothetical protein
LKFLPPETNGVAFIDVAGLRGAPLVQEMLKSNKAPFPRKLNDFMTATGFDPERDLDKVTIATVTAGDSLVIAQGRIDRFKIQQYLKDQGKTPEAYLGQTLYRDGRDAFVILDDAVLSGRIAVVRKALEQMQLPGSLPLRSDLLAAVRSIDLGNQIWGVGSLGFEQLEFIGVPTPEPAKDVLKSLRSGAFQMRVDTGVSAVARGEFQDAESAKNIGELALGALALARLQLAKQQPDMVPLIDGIQVSYTGATVTVRIDESGEQLKKLKGRF